MRLRICNSSLKATSFLQVCEVLRSVCQRNGQPIPQSCNQCVTILNIPDHTAVSSPRAPSLFFLRSSGNASVVLASGRGPHLAASMPLQFLAGIPRVHDMQQHSTVNAADALKPLPCQHSPDFAPGPLAPEQVAVPRNDSHTLCDARV